MYVIFHVYKYIIDGEKKRYLLLHLQLLRIREREDSRGYLSALTDLYINTFIVSYYLYIDVGEQSSQKRERERERGEGRNINPPTTTIIGCPSTTTTSAVNISE